MRGELEFPETPLSGDIVRIGFDSFLLTRIHLMSTNENRFYLRADPTFELIAPKLVIEYLADKGFVAHSQEFEG